MRKPPRSLRRPLDSSAATVGGASARLRHPGKRAEAPKILGRMREQSNRGEFSPVRTACLYLAVGEKQRALDWLEKAYEERDPYMAFLNVRPGLDPLRSDPRFQDLPRRMNFPPKGRSRPLPAPFLTCASDSIPFRKCAVAESTGMHGDKGEQPFWPPLPDCACETPFHAGIQPTRWAS